MRFIHSKLRVVQLVFSLLILSAFLSCKKDDNKDNSPVKTDILSFITKDANGDPIKGAITETNDIIFYWPPEQKVPDSIIPTIKISDGSTVKPASGTKVAFNQKTSFDVTGKNGTVKTYRLKISPYDPDPFINSVGFTLNVLYKYPSSEFYEYNLIQIENVGLNDGSAEVNKKIEISLIDANDAEFPLKTISKDDVPANQLSSYLSWNQSQQNTFFVSVNNASIPLGTYKKLKLKYNKHVVFFENNITVTKRN